MTLGSVCAEEIYHICYTGEQPRAKEPCQLSEGEFCFLVVIVNGRNYVYQGGALLLVILAVASAETYLDLRFIRSAGSYLTYFGVRKMFRQLYLRRRSRCAATGFGYHLLAGPLAMQRTRPAS